jgi:hypothetical protein
MKSEADIKSFHLIRTLSLRFKRGKAKLKQWARYFAALLRRAYPNPYFSAQYLLFFTLLFVFPFLAKAEIVINEIAWMGTATDWRDEWIELYNNSSDDVDLTAWTLVVQDKKEIIFIDAANKIIPAGGYYLIERTDDEALPQITADLTSSFGKGGLSNSGEILSLKDSLGNEVERLNFLNGWPAGDNSTKETMQRAGESWITAPATPKSANKESGNNSLLKGSNKDEASVESSVDETQPDSGSYSFINLQPKIYASAGEDRVSVAGAEIEFYGKAFNENGELLKNIRYLWTFGDGGYKEGRVVKHTYRFPGRYNAVLNISSGETSASDNSFIEVVPNKVYVSEVKSGRDSWIELYNDSSKRIDISFWKLTFIAPALLKENFFRFPDSTFILAKSYLTVPKSIFQFDLTPQKGTIKLLYSNNSLADKFVYEGILKPEQSFSKIEGKIVIAEETPGRENKKSEKTHNAKSAKDKQILEINSENNLEENGELFNFEKSGENKFSDLSEIKPQALKTISSSSTPSFFKQEANIFKIDSKKPPSFFKWFLLSLITGVISAVGFLILKKI